MKYRDILNQQEADNFSKELSENLKGCKITKGLENKIHPILGVKPFLESNSTWALYIEIPMLTSKSEQYLGTTYTLPLVDPSMSLIPLWKVSGYTDDGSPGEYSIIHS